MKKLLVACALALLCTSSLDAAPKQIVNSGVYVTADGGYGRLFTPNSSLDCGCSYDRDHFVWSGGIGYAWALDSFNLVGIEGDYLDNGQSTYNNSAGSPLTISSAAEAVLFSYTTVWENGIDLFLKVGPAYVQQKNDFGSPAVVNGVLLSGSATKTGITGMGVVGLGYYIAHNFNVFTDVTYTYGHADSNWGSIVPGNSPSNISIAASAQIKLGLSYQF